jgi:hypothetical protein
MIGAGDAANQSMCELVAQLPGAESVPRAPVAAAFAPLGRVPLDDELAIDWVAASPSRRFAAAWPLVARGALAVVFAHAGPLDLSIEALRPAIERIRALPRVRTLHVLLNDKRDDRSVAGLCEALSLFDDRGVVEIALADAAAAEEGLRELLQRVLA